MSNSIILVGGGGLCKVIIDILKEDNDYDEILISDLKENIGKEILGIKIEYTDDQLEDLYKKGYKNAFVSMGKVEINEHRKKLFNKISLSRSTQKKWCQLFVIVITLTVAWYSIDDVIIGMLNFVLVCVIQENYFKLSGKSLLN